MKERRQSRDRQALSSRFRIKITSTFERGYSSASMQNTRKVLIVAVKEFDAQVLPDRLRVSIADWNLT